MSTRAAIFMTIALAAATAGGPQQLRAERAPPKPTRKAIVQLQIDGGYGFLKSLSLDKDGTFLWQGYEPGRRSASMRHGKLSEQEVHQIWESADRLDSLALKDAYAGNYPGCTLVLVFDDKTTREVRMKYDKKAEEDDRPQELKTLLDKLWATRSRKQTK